MDFEDYRKKVIEEGEAAFYLILSNKRKPCEILKKESLMIEYARHGENYLNLKDNEIKFMVVGRAPGLFHTGNGEEWESIEKVDCSVIDYTKNIADREKIQHCFDTHYNEKEHLSWIHTKKEGERFIDAKPFFSLAKQVYLELTQKEQDFEWYKNICHSNIFKIVPARGGNPKGLLRKTQEKAMAEILKAEIEFYKPTHILVIDGRNDSPCFCFNIKEQIIDCAKSIGAKICFSDRPETRSNSKLMLSVIEDFNLK